MILPILTHPDPRLSQKCEPVTKFGLDLWKLIADMAETMYAANGIGLAAPQVGVLQSVAVTNVNKNRDAILVLINPVITSQSDTTATHEEGCLSIPDTFLDVTRPDSITVRYQDLIGGLHTKSASGLQARCIQHEIDHLNGILITERAQEN